MFGSSPERGEGASPLAVWGRAFQVAGILSYKGLEVKQCLTLFRNIKETNVFGRDQGRERGDMTSKG